MRRASGRLSYMNSFYYIGHFSKFIRPGARRIVSSSTLDELLTTAFLNEDGSIVLVVMNASNKPEEFLVWVEGRAAKTQSRAHSIMTLVLSDMRRKLATASAAAPRLKLLPPL